MGENLGVCLNNQGQSSSHKFCTNTQITELKLTKLNKFTLISCSVKQMLSNFQGLFFRISQTTLGKRLKTNCLRLVSTIFYQIFIFSPYYNPSKTMKTFFISSKKALFLLKIFKFLCFPLPFHTFWILKDKWKRNDL